MVSRTSPSESTYSTEAFLDAVRSASSRVGHGPGPESTPSVLSTRRCSDLSIDNFGTSITHRDLDGDGCDELAVGAPREDLAGTDGGSIRILFGHGELPVEPAVITMSGRSP